MDNKTCKSCYYWDAEGFQNDILEATEEDALPEGFDSLGYCRCYPPGPGIPDDPWDNIPVCRADNWCGAQTANAPAVTVKPQGSLARFLKENPELTPSVVEWDSTQPDEEDEE